MWAGMEIYGLYSNNLLDGLVSVFIDLSGVDKAYLEFYHWYSFGVGDYGYVMISGDAGGSWTYLKPSGVAKRLGHAS